MADKPQKVVILGGGFAGVYTGMYLAKWARRARIPVEITIVNRDNYIVFQPLLPDVISGAIEILHVVSSIRRLVPQARLITREIESIDLENKRVILAPGFQPALMTLEYDHLVLALGTVLDYSKVPGMNEHGISFKYLGDALKLRHLLVEAMEEADISTDPEERQRLLTFVVAGGGFSGVECMAELNDFVKAAAKAFQTIRPDECKFVLLQSADRILPEMAPALAKFAHQILERRGIDIRLNTRLSAVTACGASYTNSLTKETAFLPSRTTVVTVPAGPHPLVKSLPCKLERGRILVDDHLSIAEWPNVWAVGDCAAIPQGNGQFSPPTAQHATRQAKKCAENILARMKGKPTTPFHFPGLGKLGSLGKGQAVAEIMGVKISGVLAWLLWRGIYLSKLPGFDRKVRVFFDWILDLFLPLDITQVRIFYPDDVTREHFEPGEVVFQQGDVGDKLYFIAKGEAEVIKDGEVCVGLKQGDMFGEYALVSKSARSAMIRVKTPLDVVSMSRHTFEELISNLPGMKETMQSVISRYVQRLPPASAPCETASDA